jgi:hypothetical protein
MKVGKSTHVPVEWAAAKKPTSVPKQGAHNEQNALKKARITLNCIKQTHLLPPDSYSMWSVTFSA